MSVAAKLKVTLKALRRVSLLNRAATGFVRSASRLTGGPPDWAIDHVHRMGHVVSRLPNGRTLRLWSQADDWVSNQVFWKGWQGYEPETGHVYFRLAERSRYTVDVGAYVGYFTLLAAHANPGSPVLAIEPHPAIHERLLRNVALNRLSNVTCLRAAVASTPGLANLYHAPFGLPTSNSLSPDFFSADVGVIATPTAVVRLDVALPEGAPVDLVKVDTESTEPDVLASLGAILKERRPTVLCEVLVQASTGPQLEQLLGPLGYEYYLVCGSGLERRSRIEGHPRWLNYLFTARGLPER